LLIGRDAAGGCAAGKSPRFLLPVTEISSSVCPTREPRYAPRLVQFFAGGKNESRIASGHRGCLRFGNFCNVDSVPGLVDESIRSKHKREHDADDEEERRGQRRQAKRNPLQESRRPRALPDGQLLICKTQRRAAAARSSARSRRGEFSLNVFKQPPRCHAPRKRGIQYSRGLSCKHWRLWNTGSSGPVSAKASTGPTVFRHAEALAKAASRTTTLE